MQVKQTIEHYREALSDQGESITRLEKLIDKVGGMSAKLADGERRKLQARLIRMKSHYDWLENQIKSLELNQK